MMKRRLIILLFLCSLGTFSRGASAQQKSVWQEYSPAGEPFRVMMPSKPSAVHPEPAISGKGYQSSVENASYSVWSLSVNTNDSTVGVDSYLDTTADVVWEHLLRPVRDRLPEKQRDLCRMTFVKELSAKPLPGREYLFTIGGTTGTVQFFLAQERVFILIAAHAPFEAWEEERFFDSFIVSPAVRLLNNVASYGSGVEGKAPDLADPNHIFSGREVTQKVRLLHRPVPTYTDSARRFGVQGMVVLRAVFSKDGIVTNVHVIRKLPHGMTQRAIEATRGISFSPAQFQGRQVSMWMELQYNFNLF